MDDIIKYLGDFLPKWLQQTLLIIAGVFAILKLLAAAVSKIRTALNKEHIEKFFDYQRDSSISWIYIYLISIIANVLPCAIIVQIIEYRWLDFDMKFGKDLIYINFLHYMLLGLVSGVFIQFLPSLLLYIIETGRLRLIAIFSVASVCSLFCWILILTYRLIRAAVGWDPMLCMSCGMN